MSKFDLIHIPEPLLEFRYSQKLAYPRDGLFLYGPVDEGRSQVKYGAIGTPAGVARLERWAEGVGGLINVPPPRPRARAIEPQHVVFPASLRRTIRAGAPSRMPKSRILMPPRSPPPFTSETATKRLRRPSIFTSSL